MNALKLLDSRSFRNKLDYFISVASRKRPRPSDEELAEALQPVLDAYSGAPAQPALSPVAQAAHVQPLEDDRIAPQKERSLIEKMDDWVKEYLPKVQATPMQPNGTRMVAFDASIPVAEFTGYTIDRTDFPYFVDAGEMTMMDTNTGAWILPIRMR